MHPSGPAHKPSSSGNRQPAAQCRGSVLQRPRRAPIPQRTVEVWGWRHHDAEMGSVGVVAHVGHAAEERGVGGGVQSPPPTSGRRAEQPWPCWSHRHGVEPACTSPACNPPKLPKHRCTSPASPTPPTHSMHLPKLSSQPPAPTHLSSPLRLCLSFRPPGSSLNCNGGPAPGRPHDHQVWTT